MSEGSASRKALWIVTATLAVVLVVLLFVLFGMLSSRSDLPGQEETLSGITAQIVVRGPGQGAKPLFDRPMGAAWSPDGERFFVADTVNNRICSFDADGVFLREFGGFGIAKPLAGSAGTWNQGELNYPTDVATDEQGRVYVADFYNDSISVFSADGQFLRRFPDPNEVVGQGGSGQGGRGIAVTAVAVQGNEVYATDAYQVVVFTVEGEFVRQFGKPGSAPGDLDHPNGIAVAEDGRIFVSDSNNNRLTAYSADGTVLWTLGEKLAAENVPAREGQIVLPRGLALDGDSLLVADPFGQQLVRVSLDGETLLAYGQRGVEPSALNFPSDVDVFDRGVLVADRENSRVQVVQLGNR